MFIGKRFFFQSFFPHILFMQLWLFRKVFWNIEMSVFVPVLVRFITMTSLNLWVFLTVVYYQKHGSRSKKEEWSVGGRTSFFSLFFRHCTVGEEYLGQMFFLYSILKTLNKSTHFWNIPVTLKHTATVKIIVLFFLGMHRCQCSF